MDEQAWLAERFEEKRERGREPGRLADDGRRAGVPRHAALARVAARGAAGGARARADRQRRGGHRSGARSDARGLGRPCDARRTHRGALPDGGSGSSRVARAAGCREHRFPTPIPSGSEKPSMLFSPPRAAVTSPRFSPSSIRTSCSALTAQPFWRAPRGRSAVPTPWPARSRGVRASRNRRS